MSQTQLDLSQLALERSPVNESAAKSPRPRRWFSRYVVPLGILFGFVALLGGAAGRQWVASQPVTVVPVIVKRGVVEQAGATLFQSPGWIEPRPTAIAIASLAPGVIEELLVVEGQSVEKEEPIARLISIDAELELEQAKNSLAIREGELNRAKAERDAAQIRVDHPVHLQERLAEAKSQLAKVETELAKVPFLIEAAQANVEFTRDAMQQRRAAQDAIAGRVLQQSVNSHASAKANLQELRQRGPNLRREVDALQEKVHAIEEQLRLLVEETRQLHEADAKVQASTALRDEAELRVRQAELRLRRNTIRAPMDGRILQLIAAPGTRVMGLDTNAGQSSSTVVQMYNPERLQVRADVRLEDVPMVTRGQPVEIETASSSETIEGRVLQVTSSANIQKNTLEVKVELIQPPPSVRPEMLVTATFLAPTVEQPDEGSEQSERMFVPSELVHSSDSQDFVWIVDANQTARRRAVTLGAEDTDGLVEVQSGLRVTDKLIVNGAEEIEQGDPVRVTADDPSLGIDP